MLEPYEGKLSRTVLRGEGGSNAPALPDQILENKQRFISQIMTSKTPVRSADDVDEATLSYAEIKAIATGNPLIKEKMDIDVKLERLKLAKSEFLKAHEQLEHKVHYTYPRKIQDAKKILDDINRDIDTVQSNTVLDDNGQEKFSIIFNGKTFSDKKEATAFLANLIKHNSSSLYPLRGLSGEYKGLHISTAFQRDFLHEELILDGCYSSRKNSTSLPGDNINRIIEMANSRSKTAVDKQAEIDFLHDKINAGIVELDAPFPQQDEFDKLSLRSAELSRLLNDDANSSENDKANLELEKDHRFSVILHGKPDSLCEKYFFSFAKKHIDDVNNNWSDSLDKFAINILLNEGFPKDSISNTILKFSPSVSSKEDVYNLIEACSRRAASR